MNRTRQLSHLEKWHWPRLKASAIRVLRSVLLNQKAEVQVIDISKGGMLLETEMRLGPHVEVLLNLITSTGTFTITGQVLRSSITSLKGSPRYRTAIEFQHVFHELDELGGIQKEPFREISSELDAPEVFDDAIKQIPCAVTTEGEAGKHQPTLTLIARDAPSILLSESFVLNDW